MRRAEQNPERRIRKEPVMRTPARIMIFRFGFLFSLLPSAFAFEGRITTTLTRGGETQTLLYTIGTNQIRIQRAETNWPYPRNIVDRNSGEVTLLFPHNRSYLRLQNPEPGMSSPFPGVPAMPPPPGIGPTNLTGARVPPMPQIPPGVGPQPGMVGSMPPVPPMHMERPEMTTTDRTTNLLGYVCTRYELKQLGEVMEIWATDKLMPFQPYLLNQPHRFGPRMLEEQWGELLKAKKLFPLLAILKFENGPERLRFEVRTINPAKIEDKDGSLFGPPPGYQEIRPLPF